MEPTQVAYLAGVMDSDGWFTIIHHATNSRYAQSYTYSENAGCAQTSPEAVELLRLAFGGRIYVRERKASGNWKPMHYWVVSNKIAAHMTLILRPYLLVKAEQADLILALRTSKNRPRETIRDVATGVRGGKGLNPTVVAERHMMYEHIRSLNDRRPSNLAPHPAHTPFSPPPAPHTPMLVA